MKGKVVGGLGRVVASKRYRVIALEPHGKSLIHPLATTGSIS
jgi:hypothetical protein